VVYYTSNLFYFQNMKIIPQSEGFNLNKNLGAEC